MKSLRKAFPVRQCEAQSVVTFRRIVLLCGMMVLPWCLLLSQAATAKPQDLRPKGSLEVDFGPRASNPEGKAAAQKFLQAMGGPSKVDAVKSLRQTVIALRQGERIEIEQTIVYPDQQAQKLRTSQKTMLLVVTPRDAFMMQGAQLQNLSSTQRFALDATLKHDFLNVLQHINDPKYIFNATGQEKIGGVEATVVEVEADGIPTRWWIGPDGKLLQERYSDMSEGAAAIQTMTYSDWKSFGGLQYPTKYEMFNEAGQPQLNMTLISMQVNPAVNSKLFERP